MIPQVQFNNGKWKLNGIFCNITLILLGHHVRAISCKEVSFQEPIDRLVGPAYYPVSVILKMEGGLSWKGCSGD